MSPETLSPKPAERRALNLAPASALEQAGAAARAKAALAVRI
jgi:hypothetical protein